MTYMAYKTYMTYKTYMAHKTYKPYTPITLIISRLLPAPGGSCQGRNLR